jgi:thiamine kinase-like enzyme
MSRIGAEPKPVWRSVPAVVRGRVAEVAGARVRRAMRVWGGYAPSPTFRLILDGGGRLIFKGVSPASNAHMLRALEDEERVYRELTRWISPWAPAFHGSFKVAGWHVLLLEDAGRAGVPPWSRSAIQRAMRGYAEFHRHSLGQDLPPWLSRTRHHADARTWTDLAAQPGGLARLAGLAGARADEAREWTQAALPRLQSTAEALIGVTPPYALLHLDTRSDNLRLQPGGRLRLFDWPYVCAGPPELDVAFFAQTITCEGGPDPDEVLEPYARHIQVRDAVMESAVAAVAGYFAVQAWQPPIPGLPRVRSIQRRQLKTSLAWSARRLGLSAPDWLSAVPD